MKRIFTLVAVLAVAWPLASRALTVDTNENVLGQKNQTVTDTYLAAGSTLELPGTFSNDVIVAGGTVTISGPVAGDVIVAGGTITIDGPVAGNVRILGGTVEVNNTVEKNLSLVGGTLLLNTKADVKGEAVIAGGTLTMNGSVAKDVSYRGGNAIINGPIGGSAFLQLGEDCGDQTDCLVLGPNAKIAGDLNYWSNQAVKMDSGASVVGTTTRHTLPRTVDTKTIHEVFNVFRVWKFLAILLSALVITAFVPSIVRSAVQTMKNRPGPATGFGALFAFAGPIGIFILFISLLGIPLAVLTGLWYAFLFVIAGVVLSAYVGDMIWRSWKKVPADAMLSRKQLVMAVFLGSLALGILFDLLLPLASQNVVFIGFLGSLLHTVLGMWAFGALILHIGAFIRNQK